MKAINWIAFVLVIVGGINWGLVALNFNLVSTIFGSGSIEKIVYALVGLSAIYVLFTGSKMMRARPAA